MDKQELGAFLRSRRERLRPQDVGLPTGPRRRTPGLRREEVAVLAHISTEYCIRLEQGRAPRPSGDVLAAIAGALRLTDAESGHLHVLAGTAPNRTRLHRRDVRPSILALLQRLPQTAGFVMSAAFEVLAWNDLAAALMEDSAPLAPKDRNFARRAFPGPQRADATLYGISDAAVFRLSVAMQLHTTLARYPTDPAVTGLVDELRDASPDFNRLWERHDVQAAPMLTKTFRHPTVGEVTVDCDTLTLTDRDQYLVLYSAPPGAPSAEALALLNVLGAEPVTTRGSATAQPPQAPTLTGITYQAGRRLLVQVAISGHHSDTHQARSVGAEGRMPRSGDARSPDEPRVRRQLTFGIRFGDVHRPRGHRAQPSGHLATLIGEQTRVGEGPGG